jgi:hypothetical protein
MDRASGNATPVPRRHDMENTPNESRGYGKKWKKWLAIYVAIGAVAYLVVYLILQAGNGSGGLY